MSSSSAVGDAGRFPGHKSTFSQTCNLLSQFVREKRSFGDLGLGTIANFEGRGMQTTMNLFPQQSGFGSGLDKDGVALKADSCVTAPITESEVAQMTIFYAGQVIVFNDFPASKAKEVMDLASKARSQNYFSTSSASNSAQTAVESTNLIPPLRPPQHMVVPNYSNNGNQRPPAPIGSSDLPIVRRNSLHRFLDKRKDRIVARAPYAMNHSTATSSSKPSESSPSWLGLAAPPPSLQSSDLQL